METNYHKTAKLGNKEGTMVKGLLVWNVVLTILVIGCWIGSVLGLIDLEKRTIEVTNSHAAALTLIAQALDEHGIKVPEMPSGPTFTH